MTILYLIIVQDHSKRMSLIFNLSLKKNPSSFHRFPSQVSLESLLTTNNQILETTVPSGGSLRSTPSLTSLDKISITSIHSFPQRQQSITINGKVNRFISFFILKLFCIY
jgi:hypothetical protein